MPHRRNTAHRHLTTPPAAVDLGGGTLEDGLGLFLVGWDFQFLGHAVEGKPPEFFHDWRFLFVGVRWWVAKMRGRA